MAELRPFRALRPAPGRAGAVLAPPYDVVDVAEARTLADGNPDSFLHVSRPEIDLPDGTVADDPLVHGGAALALRGLVDRGTLVRDEEESYAAYRLTRQGHSQTGLVAVASVADYRAGRIATHEQTRQDKEDDRVHHLQALGAHDEPVLLLAAPGDPAWSAVTALLARASAGAPDVDVTDPAGVRHEVWVFTEPGLLASLGSATAQVRRLFVADGHHRSAAAARVLDERPDGAGARCAVFPVVVFPGEELLVLPYNRVVADLRDRTEAQWLADLAEVAGSPLRPYAEGSDPSPSSSGEVSVRIDRRWWRLPLTGAGSRRPAAALDVSRLQDLVLGPLLGIENPRDDKRLGFVGGDRDSADLARLVDEGTWASAFLLHPTSVAELVAVASTARDMPPKSTWFEPKLASGLFVHPFTAAYD